MIPPSPAGSPLVGNLWCKPCSVSGQCGSDYDTFCVKQLMASGLSFIQNRGMADPATTLFPPFPHQDYLHHRQGIDAAVQRVLESGQFLLGAEGKAFEEEFAAYVGTSHGVGVGSGTDAIEVMLRALDIGPGCKVVVPSLAAVAVASAVGRAGAGVLLADCEPESLTLCPKSLEAVLKSPAGRQVKAALVVHLFGQMADWGGLQRVAQEYGIMLLEDCAQGHGATWNGRPAGTLARAAAFSFYPSKNLGAMGDAGMVVTPDGELAECMRMIRQYGWRRSRVSEVEGVNSRMDEMQAAVLRVKLKTLPEQLRVRRRLAAVYSRRLEAGEMVRPPVVRAGCEHAWHQYVVRCSRGDELQEWLQSSGVPAARHYPLAIHQQPGYRCAELVPVPLPETERAVAEVLSLPLHPYLAEEAVEMVCAAIEQFGETAGGHGSRRV